jgi:hypothetical protein
MENISTISTWSREIANANAKHDMLLKFRERKQTEFCKYVSRRIHGHKNDQENGI